MIFINRVDQLNAEEYEDHGKVLDDLVRLSSIIWEGRVDDEVACAWGLIPPTLLSEQAYLWLITTYLVDEHKFIFVRASQMMLRVMLNEYPTIVGHVLADNKRAIRWLEWLGAEFKPDKDGRLSFKIRRKK